MVDIHSHVLPGIDDGAPDVDEAVAMARAAAGAGTATLVATPHVRADFPEVHVDELADRCEQLRDAIAQAGVELEIVCGAEVSLAWALDAGDAELRMASYAQGGSDILIETPTSGGATLPQLLYEVRRRGYRVTLAHPERLVDFHRDPTILTDIADTGVLLQVNAEAVLGPRRSSPVARLARRLCVDGLAAAVASDGHRAAVKRPVSVLGEARDFLERQLGDAMASWLTEDAPRALVAGAPLPERPEPRASKRRGPARLKHR
jgi:protein-tyrosine phosphatase